MRDGPALRPFETLLLIALSVLWGGSFFCFKVLAIAQVPPVPLVLGRVSVAAVVLWLIVRATGSRVPSSPSIWRSFIVMGLLNNAVPFCLIAFGESRISSGLAAILGATTPIFTALVAQAFAKDERLTVPRTIGVGLGLAGVVILAGPDAWQGARSSLVGQLAVVAAALSYGCAAIYGRRFAAMGLAPLVTAAGQVSATAAIMLPIAFAAGGSWAFLAKLSPTAWVAWLALAIPSTAVAYVLYFRILARAGATNVAAATFLVPVSALLLGMSFLHERLAWPSLAGMAVIFAGLAAMRRGGKLPNQSTRGDRFLASDVGVA